MKYRIRSGGGFARTTSGLIAAALLTGCDQLASRHGPLRCPTSQVDFSEGSHHYWLRPSSLNNFGVRLLIRIVAIAAIRIALEAPHDLFVGLVENGAQQPLGEDWGGRHGLEQLVGRCAAPFDHQHEGIEQMRRCLDVDDRKDRWQVDDDISAAPMSC
jgi:hypothetical protein